MSNVRKWPCTLTDEQRLDPCWALDDTLQDPYGRGTRYQGLALHSMVNLDTHKFSRHLVSVKSGKSSKKGIFANFCPFCGERIIKAEEPE